MASLDDSRLQNIPCERQGHALVGLELSDGGQGARKSTNSNLYEAMKGLFSMPATTDRSISAEFGYTPVEIQHEYA